MRYVLAALVISLAACGGTKTQPKDPIEDDQVEGGMCCCEWIEETGDGDEMAENAVQGMMGPPECDEKGGTCDEAQACADEELPGT